MTESERSLPSASSAHRSAVVEHAVAGIRGLRPYQPGKPVAELERELGIHSALKLASNENPLGPSRLAIEAIRAAATAQHVYPDGASHALKCALADRHAVDPAAVTLGNGSNEILELVGRVWLRPGSNAVFSAHAFAVYPLVTQACGAEARVVPALPDTAEQPYGHDLDGMRAAIDADTRVVFIANPNNPTGTRIRSEALRAFLQAVPENVVVVVDEAYAEYVTEADHPDASGWLAAFPQLIVTRTFSKIFGLAGVRLGYGLSSTAIADLLNRARQPFNVNALAQAAGLAALADTQHVERSVAINRAGLRQIAQALVERGLPFIPSVGNFLTFHPGPDAGWMYDALLREAVIVRPVENYGLPGYLRVTIADENANATFLDALDRVLARHAGEGAAGVAG